MSHLLSLTRAARLVGATRVELQKKMKSGELIAFDGMVAFKDLLACYPDAQLEDISEYKRVMQIKESAFGKRVFERILPDAEVLATRITDLSKRPDAERNADQAIQHIVGQDMGQIQGNRKAGWRRNGCDDRDVETLAGARGRTGNGTRIH